MDDNAGGALPGDRSHHLSPAPKVRVLLVGSCVSRDTFAFLDPRDFELSGYVARQSLASAFGGATRPVIDEAMLESRFQQRVVRADAASSLPDVVRAAAADLDLLVWDLVDERLGVHRHPDGSLTTDSVEIRSVLGTSLPEGVERVAFGSQEHLDLFTKALEKWRDLLAETGLLDRTVLLAPPWAGATDEGEVAPDSFGADALEGNSLTAPYVEAVSRVVGVPVLGWSGPPTRASSHHQWGPAPFHYDDDTYVRLAREVVGAVRSVHGPGAVSGAGTRVPSALERAPRRGSPIVAPSVSLSRRGPGLVAVLTGGDPKAWAVHLYRGDERVAVTSWLTDRAVDLALTGPGAYRVRAHLLGPGGDRQSVVSPTLRVP